MRSRSVQANQPRPLNPPPRGSVIENTRPQTTVLTPDWSVRLNDLRTMRDNLHRAQMRGAVPYDDAERLHTVINAFEDREVERRAVGDAVDALTSAVEYFESFDADTLDVTLDVLNDLDLPPGIREQIEDALEKSVRKMRTAAALAVTELAVNVKRLSGELSGITAGWDLE